MKRLSLLFLLVLPFACTPTYKSGDTTCTNNCQTSYASGVTPLVTYVNCGNSYCGASCN